MLFNQFHCNTNSVHQMAAIYASIPYIREAIDVLDISTSCPLFIIADFGASHGLNSMRVMKMIIECLREAKIVDDEQQILVVHNDLPTNDWASLFEILSTNTSYYGVASGRSFYDQCLPSNSLSIGYSSASLHWLSRKPCNLSNHCYWMFAQDDELVAFKHQAQLDYAQFFERRSRELISGGVLIVNIAYMDNLESTNFINERNLLYKCAQSVLSPEQLLNFTFPVYQRSYAECVDRDLFARCSLELIKADIVRIESPQYADFKDGQVTLDEFARSITEATRSWSQSVLRQALEINGKPSTTDDIIMAQFWTMYEQNVKERPHEFNTCVCLMFLILKKANAMEIK